MSPYRIASKPVTVDNGEHPAFSRVCRICGNGTPNTYSHGVSVLACRRWLCWVADEHAHVRCGECGARYVTKTFEASRQENP